MDRFGRKKKRELMEERQLGSRVLRFQVQEELFERRRSKVEMR